MNRMVRLYCAIALLVMLSSCSFEYRLLAVFIDGRLAFVSEEDRPLEQFCPDLSISDATGEVVWAIGPSEASVGRQGACGEWLPIQYGRAPSGDAIRTEARKLRTGVVYVLEGWAGDVLLAAFRLHREGGRIRIENLDLGDEAAMAARSAAMDRRQAENRRVFEERERARLRPDANEVLFEDRPLPAEQR